MADEKGKGKSKAGSTDDASTSGSGSSAAQTLASTLRSSLAASQLSSVMAGASGGKAEFQPSTGGGELRDWLVQDLRSSSTSAGVGSSARSGGGFRTQTSEGRGEGMFEEFERGLSLNAPAMQERRMEGVDEGWQRGYQGLTATQPLSSYTDLDGPLHASVRNDHAASTQTLSSLRAQPPPLTTPLAASEDIFALLDDESRSQPPTQPPPADLTETVLSNFDPLYRPPSPSHASFTREQAQMHLLLAEEQQSSQGRQDLVIPRPDNASLQEGAYAPTAEAALASIFDSTGRAESSSVTEESERGKEVVRRITKYFAASSYLDDVYGTAPVLRETIEIVQKEDGEKRQRAVERLEKLWQHLSNSAPKTEGAGWVDGWLANNT
ncbi:hypothetical protein PSEUBRA_004743 [Kalmanozyma brasiliensis GHG001]|uniref:uncharacterized protein n=1 Tax=Kalmanozyma brasiliensis (strain GHG001) TaxID=1365824 RepID=UPI00286826B4|nr:uncharacterized protein PSEUBRA_004743 [Kalmanozyma brasiliensis GHG001]KAF6767417.1 hypothetical protein PSEUBRA_004743 [Kalmanozyma brasiliensis GHG001]